MARVFSLIMCIAASAVIVRGDLRKAAASSGLRHSKSNQADAGSRDGHRRSLIVHDVEVIQQHLVICNAYTSQVPLEIVQVRTQESLNSAHPMAYKQCGQYTLPLQEGDQLDFKAGRLDVGTFYATGIPNYKGSLLLIAHRRHPNAVGISFESHAFTQTENPQLVVIDAYRGKAKGAVTLKIIERKSDQEAGGQPLEDDLNFDSVIAVNPGSYDIALLGSGSNMSKVPLSAAEQGKYVVIRVGNEGVATKDGSYPQELIVYPRNGGVRARISLGVLSTVTFMALLAIVADC